MESSISKKDIQRWIINKRKEIINEAWRKGIEKDKYVWTSSLLLSLEDWVWNQPKKLIDNDEWYTDTPCPNYKKKETVELDKELFEEVLHELSIASGLYACDNEKMEETFQLNYNDLINKLKKVE